MVERWTKLSDSQLKVGSLPAGLTCSNLAVVEASDVQMRGKGQGFLDVALEQAECARKELLGQNRRLRGVLLNAANELQSALHAARTVGDADAAPEVRPSHTEDIPDPDGRQARTDFVRRALPEPACGGGRRDLQHFVHVASRHALAKSRIQTAVLQPFAEGVIIVADANATR